MTLTRPPGVGAAPPAPVEIPRIPMPAEPQSIEQTGLSMGLLTDLALKTLYLRGQMTLGEIAISIGLPVANVGDKIMDFLKTERLVEIRGGASLSAATYQFVITEKGAEKAQEALARSQYIGRAPVPLAVYVAAVQRQSIANVRVDQEDIVRAFSHLVIPRETLTQLGPAINSGKSIFLFGPPGNGKTTIAEVMIGLLRGEVVLPYAVEIDGQIIKVFDQVYHRPALDLAAQERIRFDHRWVISRRPIVMTGGELTLETLDLIWDETSKMYEAPFQMKANGGIFMVDDFGRQRVSPRDLLNRWIVPLEKRVDYLTLHTGKKIEIPFDMLIVFSTNLDPADLVDEAFLRRIRYKIGIGSPTVEQYEEILRRLCARKQIEYRAEALSQILAYYRKKKIELRSCHPRDVLDQIIDTARFLQRTPALEPDLVDMACESYFVSLNSDGVPAG
ncbi:MAG: ATP-binding protein [Chloroflexi bacterium]|nr:ATP-binding protein [Chloroflexota bacterium]